MDVFLYTKLLSFSVLCVHILLLLFVIVRYVRFPFTKRVFGALRRLLRKWGLLCALITAFFATVGPLVFTYAYYFEPCTLCWYQRIFMFPLVVILFLAMRRRDYRIKPYVYALSVIGLCVGAYHYLLQRFSLPSVLGGCDAVGFSKTCTEYYFIEFGYITIPIMAMTAFVLVILFTYFSGRE